MDTQQGKGGEPDPRKKHKPAQNHNRPKRNGKREIDRPPPEEKAGGELQEILLLSKTKSGVPDRMQSSLTHDVTNKSKTNRPKRKETNPEKTHFPSPTPDTFKSQKRARIRQTTPPKNTACPVAELAQSRGKTPPPDKTGEHDNGKDQTQISGSSDSTTNPTTPSEAQAESARTGNTKLTLQAQRVDYENLPSKNKRKMNRSTFEEYPSKKRIRNGQATNACPIEPMTNPPPNTTTNQSTIPNENTKRTGTTCTILSNIHNSIQHSLRTNNFWSSPVMEETISHHLHTTRVLNTNSVHVSMSNRTTTWFSNNIDDQALGAKGGDEINFMTNGYTWVNASSPAEKSRLLRQTGTALMRSTAPTRIV